MVTDSESGQQTPSASSYLRFLVIRERFSVKLGLLRSIKVVVTCAPILCTVDESEGKGIIWMD